MNCTNMPITVNLEMTYACNAKCLFCSIKDSISKEFVPLSDMKKLIDIFAQENILRINLFGGEPFLYPDIIEIIKYAKSKQMAVTGVSNGFTITDNMCKELKKNIAGIGISVHGLQKTHDELMGISDAFDKTKRAIHLLSKNDIPVVINFTVTAINYTEIISTVEYFKTRYNIAGVALNRFIPNENLGENINKKLAVDELILTKALQDLRLLQIMYKDMKCKFAIHFPFCLIKDETLRKYIGNGCGFGESYCAVNYAGDMKMCSYSNVILGNVFQTSMREMWHNHALLKEYRTGEWRPKYCKSCNEKKCKTGCKIACGNVFGVDPLFYQCDHKIRKLFRNNNNKIRRECDGTFLVLNPFCVPIKLNNIGKIILDSCIGKYTRQDLTNMLFKEYDIPYETIEKDVSECVEKLIIAGLVREDA